MNIAEPTSAVQTVYLNDYQQPAYWIDKTELEVDIYSGETFVRSRLTMRKNSSIEGAQLDLHGEGLELLEIAIDGEPLSEERYVQGPSVLSLTPETEKFVLETKVRIEPEQNTSLEGLYRSRTMYCTQCEAEGFRKITYYLDRPDVMSDFTTRVSADKSRCPVLLSNGNLVEAGSLDNGRHFATWHDPHKKPAYLFALVAGDLAKVEDSFTTCSGKQVALEIFVEEKDLGKCDHAMQSLKKSMQWDEQTYGREYDLDIFMIVAVDDFNMGAMENKGLNIFNTSCVLASPTTTTDAGFQRVEGVVAHEYFHNWSGNRVTCRDWFQLSLKEGFTVYRDSEFSADMGSRTVKRVEDVSLLRTHQFAEDAGPMAHPIRPSSYMEISNFYTLTIYEKGAEVVRMIANLLGPELFRKGTDLYFERHDGQAVTTEDFVRAMADVSGRDFSQFDNWYNQAGTPELTIVDAYDENAREYTLTVSQYTPATPECAVKKPFHIPLRMGLIGEAGELALTLADEIAEDLPEDNTDRVLEVTQTTQSFVFHNVPEKPVPSLLRNFSAPVKLKYDYSRDDLCAIVMRDSNGFTRYEAVQSLCMAAINDAMAAGEGGRFVLDERLPRVYRSLFAQAELDQAMFAYMLTLPAEGYIAEQQSEIDPQAIYQARSKVKSALAQALAGELEQTYRALSVDVEYSADAESIARRSLKNVCLSYLMDQPSDATLELCKTQFETATNMTDEIAALTAMVMSENAKAQAAAAVALSDFYVKWRDEALVVNQWFALQARNPAAGGLKRVNDLLQHEAYDSSNPNKIRAVIGGFCGGNTPNFHSLGETPEQGGYAFLAQQIQQLDAKNPQIAARLLTPLTRWRRYAPAYSQAMRSQLEALLEMPSLSPDCYEVVSKSLA
ncbi:aminopeptidase N [Gilvimarinus sp. SDUM040013]|uniref:Aminopeptidase N n=1 Tax=Gilvimarinus gilvus TaxID=3058038 RepID=A0ABU4S213_9GAMM|nr:aminopeptidase N [Gilvimarinus sp. SDUM040013]MDO3385561.1 aminopeptidase N [Gilvimarinus sp. SDUM040013]MDX6851188.1 aminopeptidase N [Gilvimarinus sp. SDUM040013]